MAKKNDPAPLVLKGIVHDCDGGTHKAVLIGESGDAYETMTASSRDVQSFIDEKAEKYGVPTYFTGACRSIPSLKKRIGGSNVAVKDVGK